MAAPRPFPPSVRRAALARAAGLHAASPTLVGAIACAVAVIAIIALGRAAAVRLGAWVVAACESPARLADTPPGGLDLAGLPRAVLELAVPLLAAIALASIVAHLVQTRAVWLPRRRLPGAPSPEPRRVRRALFDLLAALVIGAVTVGWLWTMAPRLAASIGTPLAGAALIASLLAALAIAWVALGTGDALVRTAELAGALRMSHADKREDDRLSGADPRWRARRAQLAREKRPRISKKPGATDTLLVLGTDVASAVAGSSALLLGDGVAVAIAWDPTYRPVPAATAIGRGAHTTQLLGLARRHAIAVHRDHELASALAAMVGPLPESAWPRLAEIIAATGGRRRSI
jgi:flagellar biosynthesis protein FlhB